MTPPKEPNGNILRLPWPVAMALGGILFTSGGGWVRNEMATAEIKSKMATFEERQIKQSERMEVLEERARRAAVTTDDLQAVHDSLTREMKRTRSVMHARLDDVEYRIAELKAAVARLEAQANNQRRWR